MQGVRGLRVAQVQLLQRASAHLNSCTYMPPQLWWISVHQQNQTASSVSTESSHKTKTHTSWYIIHNLCIFTDIQFITLIVAPLISKGLEKCLYSSTFCSKYKTYNKQLQIHYNFIKKQMSFLNAWVPLTWIYMNKIVKNFRDYFLNI